jgi:MFS family permease
MMVPVGRLVVLRSAQKHELMRAIATITWPGLAAPVLGPPLGGFITTYASWRGIFFLNVPLGLIALVFVLRLIPKGQRAATRFDRIGFMLTSVACFAIMYGLDLIGREETSWWLAALSLASGFGCGAVAALHAKRETYPLVDLRVLSVRSYAVTIWGGSLFRIAIASIPFLLPLLFQVGFGLSPFASGLLVLAVSP